MPSRLIVSFFEGFAWVLWTTRNKKAIEKSYPTSQTNVLYVSISLMQRWSVLLKEKDKEHATQVMLSILGWLKNFRPSAFMASDVFEI